jgi:hypothetical protein
MRAIAARERDELLEPRLGHEHVVHGDAHLPALDRLGREDVRHRRVVDAVLGHDRRRLAAELERHGGQVLGRRVQHLPRHRRAAGVEQVVPGQARERLRQLDAAGHDGDLLGRESGAHHLPHQRRARGRELRGLEDGAVAGGEDVDQGADGQLDREVPGRDVAHDPDRLVHDVGPAQTVEQPLDRARLRLHPALQVSARESRALDRAHELGEGGQRRRMGAEVRLQRLLGATPVALHHGLERGQGFDAFPVRGIDVAPERRLLRLEQRPQLLVAGGARRGARTGERGDRGHAAASVGRIPGACYTRRRGQRATPGVAPLAGC